MYDFVVATSNLSVLKMYRWNSASDFERRSSHSIF